MRFYTFLKENSAEISLYRAMSDEELISTMKNKSPNFSEKRFKWFTRDLHFIFSRIQGPDFNNSRIETERYKNVVQFILPDSELVYFKKLNEKEYMLDRRKAHLVKWGTMRQIR